MSYCYNSAVENTKNKFTLIKNILNILAIGIIFLASIYFIYYTLVNYFEVSNSNSLFYENTKDFFAPIAEFLNPENNTIEIYKNTGFIFMIMALILPVISKMINIVEKIVMIKKEKENKIELAKKRQKEYLKSLEVYEKINTFSICLSIDYRTNGEFSKEEKLKLNKKIFLNFKTILKNVLKKIEILIAQDVFIIISVDFKMYDYVYEMLLKMLAQIRPIIKEKYKIDLIPSITTDAYKTLSNEEEIKRNHLNIKNCDFRNKSTTSKIFKGKYQYMSFDKYAGKPLGEYSVADNYNNSTFELNMVDENLEKTLTKYRKQGKADNVRRG